MSAKDVTLADFEASEKVATEAEPLTAVTAEPLMAVKAEVTVMAEPLMAVTAEPLMATNAEFMKMKADLMAFRAELAAKAGPTIKAELTVKAEPLIAVKAEPMKADDAAAAAAKKKTDDEVADLEKKKAEDEASAAAKKKADDEATAVKATPDVAEPKAVPKKEKKAIPKKKNRNSSSDESVDGSSDDEAQRKKRLKRDNDRRERERRDDRMRDKSRGRREKGGSRRRDVKSRSRSRRRTYRERSPVPVLVVARHQAASSAVMVLPEPKLLRPPSAFALPSVAPPQAMYPWPLYAIATTRKPKNPLEVVELIMPLLIHRGGLGKALYDMVQKGFQNMAAVLCTGEDDHVSWETDLVKKLLPRVITTFSECEPFWLEITKHGIIDDMPTSGNITLPMYSEILKALATKEIRTFVKWLGRFVILTRLLSILPKGFNSGGQEVRGTLQQRKWPDLIVDQVFAMSDWPWMAYHLPIDCEELTANYAEGHDNRIKAKSHETMMTSKGWSPF